MRRAQPSACEPHLRSDDLQGAFTTAERAIDTAELAGILRDAVAAQPRIRLLAGHSVTKVERRGGRFRVAGTSNGGEWEIDAGQVINASWENRFKIDRTAGLEHPAGWLHRLKYRLIVRVPERMRTGPSMTMIVGRYGDVVIRPDAAAYISWSLQPQYVERLVDALESTPDAVLAYSDVTAEDGTLGYAELDGVADRYERARRIIVQQGLWWIPNRGVMRSAAVDALGRNCALTSPASIRPTCRGCCAKACWDRSSMFPSRSSPKAFVRTAYRRVGGKTHGEGSPSFSPAPMPFGAPAFRSRT